MLIFILAALVSVGCSLAVITQKSPVRAVIFLIMAFVAQAILFVQLGGLFVAALQIIVYAGAILVLFLFIIMLLNLRKDEFGRDEHSLQRWIAFVFAGLLGIELLLVAVRGSGQGDKSAAPPPGFGSVQSIGEKLFTTYLLPFEATSILLMAAILGAIVLAKRKLDD
jgi:NADH-quinone oxidoreductase subunit J